MSFRREIFWTAFAVLTAGWCVDAFAQPVFEGRTPRGFSPSDSTTTTRFVADEDVTILVDLNEAANQTYPVIANFQTLEKSVPFYSGSFQDSTTRYMSQAIAVDDFGFIHRAWIQQRGEVTSTSTTPVYGVVYAKSVNGGTSFLDTVSVSGTLRFDLITSTGVDATSLPVTGFSTVDIVVDSKGNPRVSYAMDFSPDGFNNIQAANALIGPQIIRTGARAYNNVFFNFSNDGGSSWLPANGAVVVNDSATVIGRNTAFPRMAITRTDDIFIVYERDIASAGGEDVMLAKVDADSLTGGSAQAVIVGSQGQTASRGGVRLDPDADKGFSPDIAIGDDDVLHIAWYNSTDNTVVHKTNQAKLWADITASGWDQIVDGSTIGTFADDGAAAIGGMGTIAAYAAGSSDRNSVGPGQGEVHLFPTVVVDKQASPDRIYALWKTSQQAAAALNDENIAYNQYDYDGQTGAPVSAWLSSQVNAFPTGTGGNDEGSMFQNNTAYQIEQHWTFVDRVAAVVDDRLADRGDLHIVFSGGASTKGNLAQLGAGGTVSTPAGLIPGAVSLYYSRFNGVEWELPQVVASARQNDTQHDAGVLLKHTELFEPDIAVRSGDDNVYLAFVGGSQSRSGTDVKGATVAFNAGRGNAAVSTGPIAARPYFKVIGRVTSFDDMSVPVGGFQYQLTYNPVNSPSGTAATLTDKNLIVVTAADNSNGSGIGAATPSSSKAPGGFLTGQWTNAGLTSLGVTSLDPANSPATFVAKGAGNNVEASNDNGVFQGQTDDDASLGYAEWGDAGDKNGLLVKLNVLGSDSATNLFVIRASTPAVTSTAGATSQSVSLAGRTVHARFVKGKRVQRQVATSTTLFTDGTSSGAAPIGGGNEQNDVGLGSYFQMGASITIISANTAPVVTVVDPNASTTGFANENFNIRYIIFDDDDDVGSTTGATGTDSLQMELYFYPDNGLSSVQDIRVFATLIVDENDAFTAATPAGSGDFTESTSASNNQNYNWDDPGAALQTGRGFAAITKTLDGALFIYAVADDGVNPPVFDVSAGSLEIKHIPIIKSVSPVSTDTVDTGEFDDLAKTNPYTIDFQLVDFNDNAVVKLFYSTDSALDVGDAVITRTSFPDDVTIDLTGATEIQLSDSLRTDDDSEFDFDITAQGSTQDSVVAQGNYFIYAVIVDKDSAAVGSSALTLAVRHSPSFEFTAPMKGDVRKLNVTQQFKYTLEWQRGRSDSDADDNASISFYYTGRDPDVFDYSGTDSTKLVATTGADSGLAIQIIGGIKEDDEGAGDQFVWDFRNPPGELPKVFRPLPGATNNYNAQAYQVGATTDTAWVYSVLNDGSGNTRVQLGGAVLLFGSQESPASNATKVTMKTPPSGGQTIINGDIVRLEWDAFLIDDGTGTDDAYLRIYAAPENRYTTLSQLETNMDGVGGAQDVLLINSLVGSDTLAAAVQVIRESDPQFLNWDTKTRSFPELAGGSKFDIFIAGSTNARFGEDIYVNGILDSVATGIGSQSQKAVLSKAPGTLEVLGTDPIFSIEMGPAALTASSGDTLDFDIHINSQGTTTDQFALFLDVPRNFFTVVDQDTVQAGVQPFVDSLGAFQAPSTVAQNDTTQGTSQFMKLNFVESSITGEVIGKVTTPFDSSQVAATLKVVVKQFSGGATLDTVLQWSTESGRKTALYRGINELAAPARDAVVTLTPRSRLIVTVPLEGRSDPSDTLDVHLREIGSTQDITDQDYIRANDQDTVVIDTTTGALGDSVNILSDNFGTFQLIQIPTGIYELTVKAPGYVSGRSDTLNLFNGLTTALEPTFGSDVNGDLSPATPLGFLPGGDATGDNQVDIADANLMFSLWNLTPADSLFQRDADINDDGVINSLDLGFTTTNFNVFGAPPVFKPVEGGDNGAAIVQMVGVEDVDAWWPGREFEVQAVISNMADVTAYDLRLSYEPDKVKPLVAGQGVEQGNLFDENPNGSLFFHMVKPGVIDAAGGRIGRDWSASGEAERSGTSLTE